MDKSLAYVVVKDAGITIPEFWVVNRGDTPSVDVSAYPVFVKPARSGSSFGVTKVNREDELACAIELARQYDSKVIIEQAVSGREVGCAVLGNGSELTVGEVDQISLTHGFFSYPPGKQARNGFRKRGHKPFPRTCRRRSASRYRKPRNQYIGCSAAKGLPA
jgi:D-alanine--(R)-lactate ligase